MGRGGPAEPELVETPPTLDELLALSRAGRHAASDHLETAALAGVPTIGCRRCGGGLAGAPFASNVLAGAQLAARARARARRLRRQRRGDAAGRGRRAHPRRRRRQRADVATGYLNAYRILVSDLVVVTGGDGGPLLEAIAEVKDVPVVAVELRPRPVEPVAGRRVAFFTTAPPARTSARCAPARRARCRGRARLRQPRAPGARCARSSSASTPRSSSSRSRRPRSTSSPKRARAGARGRLRRQRASSGDGDLDERSARARGRGVAGGAREPSRGTRQPLPLGGEDGLPYSRGLMARALIAAGVCAPSGPTSSRARVEADLAARGERRRARAPRGARASTRSATRRARRRCAACAATSELQRARPADHPARRRRDRHGQVDRRDRGRATGSGSRA